MTHARPPRAATVAEVEALELFFPSSPAAFHDEWRSIAQTVKIDTVLQEMGYGWRAWGATHYTTYHKTKNWQHLKTLLEMRLMLAYLQLEDYMSGYTYHEQDEAVDALFQEMSRISGQSYQPLSSVTKAVNS